MKQMNVDKTVTLNSAVFMAIADAIEGTNTSFSEELNNLCQDGIEARKAPAAGGSDNGGE